MPKLRILAIHRYFWPDSPPYASMLRMIATRWVGDGHAVDVFSTQPSYKSSSSQLSAAPTELLEGIRVTRISLLSEHGRKLARLLNVVLFVLAIWRHVYRNRRYDVIMVSTAPPVLLGWAVRVAAAMSGARMIYHCMDLHPEIGRISGEFSHPLLFRWLRYIDARTCEFAARVVVLSEDMAESLRQRDHRQPWRIEVINNFELPDFEKVQNDPQLPADLVKPAGVFRILFAGNIGRFQGLEQVLEVVQQDFANSNLELLFLGDGKARETLQTLAGDQLDRQVRFVGHQPLGVAKACIRSADLCLVTLVPDIFRYAYPSKTMTYLAQGKPLFGMVEVDSQLAATILQNDVGVVANPGDRDAIKQAISELLENPDKLKRMGENARSLADSEFSATVVLPRWSALLADLQTKAE